MPWTPPSSVKNVVIAPLNKGMVLDQASQLLEDGAFVRLEGVLTTPAGLRRIPGYIAYANSEASPYRVQDYVTVWNENGDTVGLLVTDKVLYVVSGITGLTEVSWAYSTGTVTVAGSVNVTGAAGAAWTTNDIMPGDLFRVGSEESVIKTVDSATGITLEAGGTITNHAGGTSYSIQRSFTPGRCSLVDTVVFNGKLLIADGKHELLVYDSDLATLDFYSKPDTKFPSSNPFVPNVVTTFMDRIWVANVEDAVDGVQTQRIRWSNLADQTDFSTVTSYLDLHFLSGEIRKMMPFGDRLAVYFDDGIYLGVPTNYPLAPLRFDKVETGGIGISGPHAVCSWLNSHYFVGQDDAYMLDSDGVRSIGSTVRKESMQICLNPVFSYVVADPANSSIVFGLPTDNEWIQNFWYYEYRTKAWSYVAVFNCKMIANPIITQKLTWLDLSGTWTALGGTYATWTAMGIGDNRRFLFQEYNGKLFKGTPLGLADPGGSSYFRIISKDFTFGSSDANKSFMRLSVKIDRGENAPDGDTIYLSVQGSTTRGKHWFNLPDIVIPAGEDESYCTFRVTGSTFRFWLASFTGTVPFDIIELGLRVRMASEELVPSRQG